MTEARGGSQASYASKSEYSESTVLNQDLADPDLFQADSATPFKGQYVQHVYTFKSPRIAPLDRSNTIEEMQKRAARGERPDKAEVLMERLVARPNNSQAIQSLPSYRKMETTPQPSVSKGTPLAPRPPPGKTSSPTGAFRTTMFKRDYQRRQNFIKAKQNKDTEDTPKLSVQMLHKPQPKEEVKTVMSESEPSINGEDDVFAELEELMGPGTDTGTAQKTEDISEQSTPVTKSPEKQVTFDPSQTTSQSYYDDEEEDEEEEEASANMVSRGATKMTEEDVMRVTGEIPIIEKRERPSSGTVRPSSAEAAMSVLALKRDSSQVLAYMKKNKYDDTVPENDRALDNLIMLRERLGWQTEIPRHAPGCKASLAKMKDIPDDDPDAASKMKTDDGEFVYCLLRDRKNRRARYDPYDLQVVSPNEARASKIYWTISASFITRVTI